MLGIIGRFKPSPKVAALLLAHDGSEESFCAVYDKLQPTAEEVGEFITLCGRMAGIKDQDIIETLELHLEESKR